MDGTTLTTAHFGLLAGTIFECLPEGITLETINSWRLNKEETRKNMAFLASMAPEPKRKPKSKKPTRLNPAELFVTSPKLYVDSSFTNIINLAPCADDARELKVKFPLGARLNDTAIASKAGGKEMLRVSVAQFMRECQLAITGGRTIFTKGGWYLVYLEDTDGELAPVDVSWGGGRLYLHCYRFDQCGLWSGGRRVCGN